MKLLGCLFGMAVLGCLLWYVGPALGMTFKFLAMIWNGSPWGPYLVLGLLGLMVIIGFCGGDWTLMNPAKQRYYHVWTAADGVSVPMTFVELQTYPPDTLVCMMHKGVLKPGDWYDLKDFTAKGMPVKGAMDWPPLPHSGLLSTFISGPQPPDLSP